jgi:N utilization substance protein B
MAGRRSAARQYAVLALYEWRIGGLPIEDILRHYFDDPVWVEAVAKGLSDEGESAPGEGVGGADYDRQLFHQLLVGVAEHADAIDETLRPWLDRPLLSVDPVERAILSVGTYELLFSPQLPVGVVLNECIELAKRFGAEQSHRYVNGVLDKLARQVRRDELSAKSPA